MPVEITIQEAKDKRCALCLKIIEHIAKGISKMSWNMEKTIEFIVTFVIFKQFYL